MLDTSIYIQALNNHLVNSVRAEHNGDFYQSYASLNAFCRVLSYCGKFGFDLTTKSDEFGVTLRRNTCEPFSLIVLLEGRNGYHYHLNGRNIDRFTEGSN